ncbi:tape measure protein [Sanguibacter sp. HDW7]|uniref:tape measure protein n=1 Tax=Sanguibacter sp. HDW7 TaxID=2714931 RepID=UPI0021069D46|nr:tape measure protein [Sanguibacter sp. HDW7]
MGDVATGSFTKVTGSIGKLVGAAGIGGLALAIGKAGLGFQDFQQKSQLAFATMLGSADKAKTFLADVYAFAKETPFSFKDLTSSAQNLISFGVDAERVIPIMRTLTDTAIGAGKGIQEIDGMATVLGQISAKGRLQTEEILQLAERGVPAMAVLANKAGKTVMDFQKDVSAGLIDSNQAIDWLIDGLAKGTDGINGFTPAYEGLSKALKESGGITATMDAARSAFTQASSELMKSLVPSLLSLVNAGTDVLKVVKWLADQFNGLPKPLRDAALALAALAVANKALNLELGPRSQAVFTGFVRGLDTSRVAMHSAGRQASTMRLGLDAMKSSAKGVKTALMGAFGGPVGIAVMGVTMALSAYSSKQAAAAEEARSHKDAIGALADELDRTGRLLDEEASRKSAVAAIEEVQLKNGTNLLEFYRDMGGAVEDLASARIGDAEAAERVRKVLEGMPDATKGLTKDKSALQMLFDGSWKDEDANAEARAELAKILTVYDDAVAAAKLREEATNGVADAYSRARREALNFTSTTDPVVKAIQEQANAAASAFSGATGVGTFKLNLSTKDDVTKAREAVAEATKNVRREEQQLAETRGRKDVKGSSIAAAEDAVTAARKRAEEAAKSLADVEARRDPVAQYRKQLKEQQKTAETFRADMIKLAEQGLNGTTFQELLLKGPEGSADARKALLGDKSLIGETNAFQETMDGYTKDIEWMAKANAARLHFGGQLTAEEFNLGLKAGLLEGSVDSLKELADKLGSDPATMREVGRVMGLAFTEGFKDAGVPWAPAPQKAGFPMIPGYATGGIYPGYTPGRDIGFIGVSGGEAIMRPEFTRAMGADWIHRMNALARTTGVGGVQKEMQRFLGGFANGGIPAPRFSHAQPQVIRVTESQTVGYPMTVENVNLQVASPDDFARQMRARRRAAWTGGRP